MTNSEAQPQHPTLTDYQAELLPALLDGQDPGAYVVIQVGDLSTLLRRCWTTLERDRRQITEGRHAFRLMGMLSAGDFIVDTRYRSFNSDEEGQ